MNRTKIEDVTQEDGFVLVVNNNEQNELNLLETTHVAYKPSFVSPVTEIVARQLVTIWKELNGKNLWIDNSAEGYLFIVS